MTPEDNMITNRVLPQHIDFSKLMDLRVDFAFKLLFSKGDPRLLISLLNAIFANKNIRRIIKSLTIKNPHMEKESGEDKLSVIDIRAEIDDGSTILIEMHMYGLGELKAKTIRSWARAYAENLETGKNYAEQPPTITIAFTNGSVKPLERGVRQADERIHRFCMIMDCENHDIFTDAMELHYIDMKAFAKAVNSANTIDINENACKNEEEIFMAVSNLAQHSEDKYTRQAYQRRQDEIYFYNKEIAGYKQQIEEAQVEIKTLRKEIESLRANQQK